MNHELPDDFEHGAAGAPPHLAGDGREGRDGELLLHKCCADLGVNFAMALQVVAWGEENQSNGQGPRSNGHGQEADRAMAAFMKMLRYMVMHPDPIHVFAIVFAFGEEVPLLDHMINFATPAGQAKRLRVSREAVNKVVLEVQAKFGLAERQGQRSAKARRNMSQARKGQLKPESGGQKSEGRGTGGE